MRTKEAIICEIIRSYSELYPITGCNTITSNKVITPASLQKKINSRIGKANPYTGHLICMVAAKDRKETIKYLDSLNFHDIECTGVETAVSRLFPFLMYDEHRTFGKTFPEIFRYHIIIARWSRATWATIAVNRMEYGEG